MVQAGRRPDKSRKGGATDMSCLHEHIHRAATSEHERGGLGSRQLVYLVCSVFSFDVARPEGIFQRSDSHIDISL